MATERRTHTILYSAYLKSRFIIIKRIIIMYGVLTVDWRAVLFYWQYWRWDERLKNVDFNFDHWNLLVIILWLRFVIIVCFFFFFLLQRTNTRYSNKLIIILLCRGLITHTFPLIIRSDGIMTVITIKIRRVIVLIMMAQNNKVLVLIL